MTDMDVTRTFYIMTIMFFVLFLLNLVLQGVASKFGKSERKQFGIDLATAITLSATIVSLIATVGAFIEGY